MCNETIALTVNGVRRQVAAAPELVLLDYLRRDLKLTGAKQSCDRKGQCGACTVIVNGKAVRSCLTGVAKLDGADVITVEGLGTPEDPHPIQEAYVLTGAVQCGFCTPGLIMATKALLDQNPNPDLGTIKRALAHNLCRCTGYKKIIEAVQLAARFLRGETTPEKIRAATGSSMLGVSHPRPTAMIKACGVARFGADIDLPAGVLELAQVHSTESHALIKSIDTAAAVGMPGVVGIITAGDIRGTNRIRYATADQPVLCEDKVRTLGDPVAAVAAVTREQARAAAAAIEVVYEPLPVMMTPAEAMAPGAYRIHAYAPGNILATQPLVKGDADRAIKEARIVVEAVFGTQTNHQAPLEPEVASAYFEGGGDNPELVVVGRSINIHFHLAQIKEAVGYDNMRYREAFSGGQFGVKLHLGTEAITAAAALHFKRAIRYVPSLEESMLIGTKRYAYPEQKARMAADETGRITAYCNDFVSDKGAYTAHGAGTMMRSLGMLAGPYHIPNIKARGRTVYTNNAIGGAARGAGPPEVAFALESMVDMLAEKAGVDPLEFRRMNSLQPGQEKATGMIVDQWNFENLCTMIKPYYGRAKIDARAFNAMGGTVKRGVGIGAYSFGIGGPEDTSSVSVEVDPDNGVTVYAAVADPGEGNDAMLSQLAAHMLGLPLGKVRLYTRDTEKTVGMGPAAGSRMTFMAGNALIKAIQNLQKAMQEAGADTYAGLKQAGKPFRYEGVHVNRGSAKIDPRTGLGDSYISDVHNIQMVEAEVNTETGAARVLKITTVVDAGTIINPQAFSGQLEGGMDQGVGYALREEYIHGKSKDYVSFKFPTIRDCFESKIIICENPRQNGPFGATGIGEMTMVSTAPAVTNAIYDACGARIFTLPATPEKIKAALTGTNRKQ